MSNNKKIFLLLPLFLSSIFFPAYAEETTEYVAKSVEITTLYHSARKVISDNQKLINDASKGDKGLTADLVIEKTKENFKGIAGKDLDLSNPTNAAMIESVKDVMNEAQALINHLAPFAIDEIYTSDFTRCVQTVTPLGESRGLVVSKVPSLNESTFESDPERSITFANALKQDERNILICSHNPVIPTMLRGILNTKLKNKDLIKLEPGDAWLVHRVKGEIVALDYLSISF